MLTAPTQRQSIVIRTDHLELPLSIDEHGVLKQGSLDGSEISPELFPCFGGSWIWEPALRAVHADGNTSTDLRFVESTQTDGEPSETRVVLRDPQYPFTVTLVFRAYAKHDVIEQWAEIQHEERGDVMLTEFASASLTFGGEDWWITHWHGDWAKEMQQQSEHLGHGIKLIDSKLGTQTTKHHNPSVLIAKGGPAQENEGMVVGATLAWSGNFRLAFEVDAEPTTRMIAGINPFASQYHLQSGKLFRTPALLWTISKAGTAEVSHRFHRWAQQHGVRDGEKQRAILLNNWEATFFDFDEKRLVKLFDGAQKFGMELFLLDDGWFGRKYPRDDDKSSLGDWVVDERKLPSGIGYLVEEAHKRGLKFGIWIEPEMINPVSELYEAHPEWAIRQNSREPHLVRTQLVLDLTNPEVKAYSLKVIDDLLTQNPGIEYVKWDCNRCITNGGSTYLPGDRQSHLYVEYVRALYEIMDTVAKRHPNVHIMLCSGGGGRVDYGALPYFHEFWPSDNTDPLHRIKMQWSYSYFFPTVAVASHVTRFGNRPIKFCFDVAMSARLGMDIQPENMTSEEQAIAKAAVAEYKLIRDTITAGDLYRLVSPFENPNAALMYVSKDSSQAVFFAWQLEDAAANSCIPMAGLDASARYRITELNIGKGNASTLSYHEQIMPAQVLLDDGISVPIHRQFDGVVLRLDRV